MIGGADKNEMGDIAGSRRNRTGIASRHGRLRSVLSRVQATHGAELVEFGLALPILLVLVVGIIDFARAYNTKHVMSNAAREAARLIVSTPLSNSSCPSGWDPSSPGSGTPCPVQAAAISVANYMVDAGLNTASCLGSVTPTYSTTRTWTYTCSNVTLVIDKAYIIPGAGGGPTVSGTHVTLSYPYRFMFGRVVGLLSILGVNATGPKGQYIFTTETVMQNLSAD